MLESFKFWKSKEEPKPEAVAEVQKEVEANFGYSGFQSTPIFVQSYNGEKTPGEIGSIKEYIPDYIALRARSWQFFMESDITQTIIKKYVLWVVGGGLKLQSEPLKNLLKEFGHEIDHEKFSKSIESRFGLFAKSKRSSWSGMSNLNELIAEAEKNAFVGGDVLILQRFIDKKQTIELIDGANVISPPLGARKNVPKSNTLIDGVEINEKGTHVAFHVKDKDGSYKRITALDPRGRKMAWLHYGVKLRINDTRGVPMIFAVMETVKMLDRYKNATVGSAEERQKIAYSVEHNSQSTGENHLVNSIAGQFAKSDKNDGDLQNIIDRAAENIALTSQKQVHNLPIGATLKALSSDNELSFGEFYSINANVVCATVGIPPEIAFSKYDSNFSASRAAIKDWEHTLLVRRGVTGEGFYDPIYTSWLDYEVLKNKISIPGYKKALFSNDYDVLDSFRCARWQGASVPHIDPLKEVKAEREKLGELGKHIPLTTVEAATRAVNGGESSGNIEQFIKELENFPKPEVPEEKEVEKVKENEE